MATRTLSRRSRRAVEDEGPDDYDPRTDDAQPDDEPPRRGRSRRSRRDDDEGEDEAPRRSSRSRRDDDEGEDEPPRRSRRSRDDDEEERKPRSSRRSRDDDGEDERPRRSKPNSTGKGWKAFKQKREETSDFVKNYTLPEKASLIKILDEEPFSVYAEHWLDDLPANTKKSYVCIGEDCPLCDIGEKARVYSMFNILDLSDPENPVVKPWKVSQTVTDILEGYAEEDKTSPLNREDLYWSIHKTGGGKKGRVQTHLNPVKARDLDEDWDFDPPLSEDELDEFTLFAEDDVLFFNTRRELKELADSLD